MADNAHTFVATLIEMPIVEKSALLPYPAHDLFALVDAVEQYPEFLPWCRATHVDYRDAQLTRATLEIDFRGIRQSFTTENTKIGTERMNLRLVKGPFRRLDGTWTFLPLGDAGELDAGAGTRLWKCGGGAALGKHCGARGTFWNIRSASPLDYPPAGFGPPTMNFIALFTTSPGETKLDGKWFEAIAPVAIQPQNLYEAQRTKRLAVGK